EHPDHQAGRTAGSADQQFEHPSAGRAHRTHLRPQGPDRAHHPYRAAQHGGRHPPDRAAAVDISRRSPQRADRRRHHSVRAVLCRYHPGGARGVGQSAVGRRDRFRPDRGRHRDHGGGDLPPAVADNGAVAGGTDPYLAGDGDGHEDPRHPVGGIRRFALHLLCRRHHHRRLPAAVHAERRRGQHFRADGAHLCLRARRRPAGDLHGDAGAERHHPA
ncbi:hypothetical protein KXV85_001854, partial [Aspergillus fumigatus]